MIESIKSLFLRRFHGASSINGFYYQIVNSVLISCDLFKDKNAILTLEGIEDIDYAKSNSLYIQVKYRKNGLSWTEFIKILKGFAQIYEVDKYRTFQIITNKNFASSIMEFNNNQKKRNKTKKNFINNPKVNLTSDEYDDFFNLIDYRIFSIDKLEEKIINSIIVEWNCLKETSILIYKKLITDYIEIAINRGNVDYQLLNSICNNILEVTSTEEYNAFGKGLIERINWNKTGSADSFYLGKITQPEHIGQNLDIRREKWLNIIFESFKKTKTTIIKASSGQGKSALLYRYSKDNGIEETTYIIRRLKDETDIVNIERYLTTILKIGLPLLVLIDNLDNNTKLWSKLIARCESQNINFLISVREEQWYKYSKYSDIRFEIVSPFLDIDEAKEIFDLLKNRKLIRNQNSSGLEIFDFLGEPKLLIEFMFLCTQGQMLEEKLKDQLAELSKLNKTSTKIKIIRYVSLASVVGIELTFKQIRNLIDLNEDIQEIIESLKNEYIEVNDKTISGFHLVRSKHLVVLLHSNYLPIIETAKELIQFLDSNQLQTFFSNLIIELNINYYDFLYEFRNIIDKLPLDKIIELINAVYKAGIHNYVQQNKQMINEAYDLIGFSALSLLAYEIMPKREESGFDSIFEKLSKQGHFPKLKEISQKENKVDSGIEYVKKLIEVIEPEIRLIDYKNIGIFLNWCNYVNYEITNLDKMKEEIIFKINYENIEIEDLCRFTFGLFCYDDIVYHQFMEINEVELLDFLKLELECYKIELTSNEITIHFIPILSSYPDITDQAVIRLEKIYMLFPYLKKYNSKPKEELFEGLKPSVSNNEKMMNPKYLLPSIDKKRNSDFLLILELPKIPKTSYDIQKYWYDLRSKSITFMSFYSDFIIRDYKGLNPKREEFDYAGIGQILIDIIFLLEHSPYIGKINKDIINLHKSVEIIISSKILNDWSTSILNYYGQFSQFANGKSDQIKLCLHNFKDAINYLSEFHYFFDNYFQSTPDYFNQDSLKISELKFSNDLYDLLELKFIEKFDKLIDNPIKYIQNIRVKRRKEKIKVIMNQISNKNIFVSDNYLEDKHLTYLPIVYECSKPLSFPTELSNLLLKLSIIEEEIFHYYWFIPVYKGKRYNEFGNLISTSTIMKLKADPNDYRWESFMPQVVPENIIALIPDYKTIVNNKVYDSYANIEAIKANDSFLTNLELFVSNLPEANKFEKLLKEKYFGKINEMKQEILNSQLSI
ncbi:MAG: hypothetical protein HQ534_12860 [Armatimonadetes bacterium]|nr:hypothetical protein [Armatimonadota bacterium]